MPGFVLLVLGLELLPLVIEVSWVRQGGLGLVLEKRVVQHLYRGGGQGRRGYGHDWSIAIMGERGEMRGEGADTLQQALKYDTAVSMTNIKNAELTRFTPSADKRHNEVAHDTNATKKHQAFHEEQWYSLFYGWYDV